MRIFSIAEHMITGLGCTLEENLEALSGGISGLRSHRIAELDDQAYTLACVDRSRLNRIAAPLNLPADFTFLETILATSIHSAIEDCPFNHSEQDVLVLISSTKGNIDLIDSVDAYPAAHPIHLTTTAKRIQVYFDFAHTPIVVSHACTSGLMAVIMASRLLEAGAYKYAVVSGVDVVAPFTISGFQALGAIDPEPCKPYDKSRAGINLGEGCGTVVLSASPDNSDIALIGSGISNDANHISGPSRTGAGLIQAIEAAVQEAKTANIDHISAHGTATLFNDEMEAQAFHRLGMEHIPLMSAKGYWGHTLGAAGILELIALMLSMRSGQMFASAGYREDGLTLPLNVVTGTQPKSLNCCLKTSSGFGGSNSALIIERI